MPDLSAPQDAYLYIADEARVALTGDAEGGTPSDAQLRRIIDDKLRGVLSPERYGSLIGNGAGWVKLTGDDLKSFYVAVGNLVAARYIRTPAGAQLVSSVIEVTTGPVTTRRQQTAMKDALAGFERDAVSALRKISLIGSGSLIGDTVATGKPPRTPETVFDQAFPRTGCAGSTGDDIDGDLGESEIDQSSSIWP